MVSEWMTFNCSCETHTRYIEIMGKVLILCNRFERTLYAFASLSQLAYLRAEKPEMKFNEIADVILSNLKQKSSKQIIKIIVKSEVKDIELNDIIDKLEKARLSRNQLIHQGTEPIQDCFYPYIECHNTEKQIISSIDALREKIDDLASADYMFNSILWAINEERYTPLPFSGRQYQEIVSSWIFGNINEDKDSE